MRTNIVLDDRLVQEALKYAPVKTKKDLIDLALREFVDNKSRLDLTDLQGRIRFRKGYDHKKMRRSVTPAGSVTTPTVVTLPAGVTR